MKLSQPFTLRIPIITRSPIQHLILFMMSDPRIPEILMFTTELQ